MDLALFKPARERGMAFDEDARPSQELLHPLGDSKAAWPQLRELIKGSNMRVVNMSWRYGPATCDRAAGS